LRGHACASGIQILLRVSDKVYNVLFLCTHNSARSIMAEAIINSPAIGRGRLRGFSAGSTPGSSPNRFALEQIGKAGLPTIGLRSKDWDEFAKPHAPKMDFVFTVCDNAANEPCPVWPGQPMTAHWGLADPSLVKGPDDVVRAAFHDTFCHLWNRINVFANLPLEKLDRLSLKQELDRIGKEK
jgi:arsenate reductase